MATSKKKKAAKKPVKKKLVKKAVKKKTVKRKKKSASLTATPATWNRIGYKKLCDGKIATLSFPPATEFVFSHESVFHNSTMCVKHRASMAHVECIVSRDGQLLHQEGASGHDRSFIYRIGKTVVPNSFDRTRRSCSHGIHFFLTKQEAVAYNL